MGLILVALMLAQTQGRIADIVTERVITGYPQGVHAPGEPLVTISKQPQGCGFAIARVDVDDAALERRAHAWRGQTIDVEAAAGTPDSCITQVQAILARSGVLSIRLAPALPVVKLVIPAGRCRFEMDDRAFSIDKPGESPHDWSAFQLSIVNNPATNPGCFDRVMGVMADWGVVHLDFSGK